MITKDYDIVIIGSGAGGGTAAKELAPLVKEGLKIVVLEWGPQFREEEFTGREIEMANRLYFEGGGFLTKDRSMTLAFAKAYGGTTVVYTGTSLVVPKKTVGRWSVPGISWEDLARRSEKYKQENNVHLLDEPLINENNRLFYKGCKELGYSVEQFPLNLRGCQGSGLCNLGCPNQAKQGTNRVQLPQAQKQGVEVVTRCEVKKIDPDKRTIQAVIHSGNGVGLSSAWQPGFYEIHSKVVVVAAGAVNSSALLLRSGLGSRLPALGRYFTVHPALILTAQHDQPVANYYGHPKSYFSSEWAESDRFLLETCAYFPFTTAKNLAGFGPEHGRFMARMDRLQMILVLALDEALGTNRVTIDRDGSPVVDYTITETVINSFIVAMRKSAEIFFAAGAGRVHAPACKKFTIESEEKNEIDRLIAREDFKLGKVSITGAHLMGGCRMGTNETDSVTNSWGQVHGIPWLYVADASLFPKCAEINPYLTIMALADRVAEGVKNRIGELVGQGAINR
ncbi:MAG: GMC family oxidoreductase [Elusimicrobia bacterium]|nr:GMC family oxidoreductase [Elusimicrobiota bacterium]